MMSKRLHVILIDDHPMTIQGYESVLELMDYEYTIIKAYDIDQALTKARQQPKEIPLDIAFIDINLPESKNTNIAWGEGLALKFKSMFPRIKIIIPTLFEEAERIRHIVKTVKPDALLLKRDFTTEQIQEAIEKVLQNEIYYSKSVQQKLRHSKLDLDEFDMQILVCLSKQIKIKEMPDYIPLALRTIEERKSILMDKFGVPPRNNKLLVALAKEKGLL